MPGRGVKKEEGEGEKRGRKNKEWGKIQLTSKGFLLIFLPATLENTFQQKLAILKNSVPAFPPQETQIKLQGWGEGLPLSFLENTSNSIVASLSYLNQHVVNKAI